ncbi:MAG: hypothetical protein KME43_13010 [Myxacorys chilensis ATA2-1-KO14]|nr:hypothetical protein [Myxacorys chilensis ATA2-1-KO14]
MLYVSDDSKSSDVELSSAALDTTRRTPRERTRILAIAPRDGVTKMIHMLYWLGFAEGGFVNYEGGFFRL